MSADATLLDHPEKAVTEKQKSYGCERSAHHNGLLRRRTGSVSDYSAARRLIAQVDDLDRVAFANRSPGPKIDLIGALHRRTTVGGESVADKVSYMLRLR